MNIMTFSKKKKESKKISMVTCYDYTSARILDKTSVDCLLVGDSLAMTMYGYKDTIAATLDMMRYHTEAVARGIENKFIITDLPFLSYRQSLDKSMAAVQTLIQAGAHAVKLEGAMGNETFIQHLTTSGIPVMGHLGLTLQHKHMLGGFKVQGKTLECAEKIKAEALQLQAAGCFAVVLECMPNLLAKEITQALTIPTIGIGAGPYTDGQVLVWQDLLGLNIDFKPKFVKSFLNGYEQVSQAIENFISEINAEEFPNDAYSYGN